MNCWICGRHADTGEHRIKSSDLKLLFGSVTQSRPVFLHVDNNLNNRVGSLKSKKLHFDSLICAKCNNELSQPYDRAWENFSTHLLQDVDRVKPGKRFRFKDVFPGKSVQASLDVHLFFVKLFGCRIEESGIPIDLEEFRRSLIDGTAQSEVYLRFGRFRESPEQVHAIGSDIHASFYRDRLIAAAWFYGLNHFCVQVIYLKKGYENQAFNKSWHPKHGAAFKFVFFD